jgi:folate-binding protein YgfZ
MNTAWNDHLARLGAQGQAEHFGDPTAELAAARDGTVIAQLAEFGLIRIAGEDAKPYLHNLLTNDVKTLAPDGVRFAGLCTAKGRLIASFHIWHDGNGDLLLMLSADILPGILKKLGMYVLRSKAKLSEASAERVLLGLSGPQAEELVRSLGAAAPFPLQVVPFADGQVLRLDQSRFVLAVAPAAAAAVWDQLAATAKPIGTAAWRWLEIAAGQPRIVTGTQEAFVPQMVNFEVPAVGGVSFTKGCYPGQEIVARAQYLGKVKRRMYRASVPQAPAPGAHVFAPETADQHCGAIVTAAPAPDGGYDALVVVQESCADAGDVRLDNPSGPQLQLRPLPYSLP